MCVMEHTTPTLIILGFSEYPVLQIPLFLVFLSIYTVTVVGNLGMIIIIKVNSKLHTIMYFFLSHLSFVDFCFSTVSQSVSSVAQSCPTLCDPMNRSTPGLPVHHQLPEFTQTHIHRVSDAIQPSHPLSSPSPPAPNPSQHQSLFQ